MSELWPGLPGLNEALDMEYVNIYNRPFFRTLGKTVRRSFHCGNLNGYKLINGIISGANFDGKEQKKSKLAEICKPAYVKELMVYLALTRKNPAFRRSQRKFRHIVAHFFTKRVAPLFQSMKKARIN